MLTLVTPGQAAIIILAFSLGGSGAIQHCKRKKMAKVKAEGENICRIYVPDACNRNISASLSMNRTAKDAGVCVICLLHSY